MRDVNLDKELQGLERLLRNTLISSKEFKTIKKKIKESRLRLNILLLIMATKDKPVVPKVKSKIKLSNKDKKFLRLHGIKW